MKRVKQDIANILRVRFLVGENAVNNWKKIIFFVALGFIMIASGHRLEYKVYFIAELNDQVKELRGEFADVRSQLQKSRLESSLLQSLEERGLRQSQTPPHKIKVIVKE